MHVYWRKRMNMSEKYFYNEVSKEIKQWIKLRFSENKVEKKPGTRGQTSQFTNNDLIEIALEVKKVIRGEKVNPNKLEKITGIGRQTWSRRISEELKRVNTPIIEGRKFGLEDDDEINHTNIDFIVERYGNKPNELINQLYHLEESRIKYYVQLKNLKEEVEKLHKYKKENGILLNENKVLKEKAAFYEEQYKNVVVSSWYPDLRKNVGIGKNVIDLFADIEKNTTIINVKSFFEVSKHSTSSLLDMVNEKTESKKAGEELLSEIKEEFSDFFKD